MSISRCSTIGLVEACNQYVTSNTDQLGGAQGLVGADSIIPPSKQGLIDGYYYAYVAIAVIAGVALLVYWYVSSGRLGLRLRTARESEPVAQALGIDIPRARLAVFVITSAVLGLVGAFRASYDAGANKSVFDFSTLLLLFAMIVVGGINSPKGILLGTALLQFIEQHYVSWGAPRLILLGVIMLLITLFTTDGLAGIPGADRPTAARTRRTRGRRTSRRRQSEEGHHDRRGRGPRGHRADRLAAARARGRISKAVRTPSVNPKYPGQVYDDVVGGEGEVSKLVAEVYTALGADVDVWAIEPGRENAVGVVAGPGRRPLADLQRPRRRRARRRSRQVEERRSVLGRIDGDRIWGRGSTDMKAGILAQAYAARALGECGIKLQGDLILEAVVGEEVMDHECGVTATVKRGYMADAAVVSEPSAPPAPLAVIPVSPGLLWFSVTVPGKATHASMRGATMRAGGDMSVGVNAIDKGVFIFQALRQLEDEWGLTKQHPLFSPGHFTLHPGVVTGGPYGVLVPFVISEFMTIEYCVWYHPEEDPEDVKREIETHIDRAASMDVWLREHPPVVEWKMNWPANTPDADEITAATCAAHERAALGTRFEGPAVVCGFAAVEDASWLTKGGTPAISYGPGDLRVAHADDEYVLIDEVMCAARTYALLAMDWCGVA